jgi:hypothetical protein
VVAVYCIVGLKGQCHEIFDLWFFSSNNPIWAPDSRVKAFSNMASNSRSYSTKSVPEQCQWHRYGRLSGVIDSGQAARAVSMTPHRPPRRIQLCKLCSKSCGLSGVNDTAQAIWHRSGRRPRIWEALATFKGNLYTKKLHRQTVLPYSYNYHTKNIGVI